MSAPTPVQAKRSKSRARARSDSAALAKLFELAESGQAGLIANRWTRFRDLLLSPEHNVRVQAERLLLEQEFGKPRQAVDHSGEIKGAEVRFVVEAPANETSDEWLARHATARKAADEVLHDETGGVN